MNRIPTSELTSLSAQLSLLAKRMEVALELLESQPEPPPAALAAELDEISLALSGMRQQARSREDELAQYRALNRIAELVNSSLDLNVVLRVVMDTIVQITGAERAFLLLSSPGGETTIPVARNWARETVEPADFAISHTIVNQVLTQGLPVLTTNAQTDPRYGSQDSITAQHLLSILCVPLVLRGERIGAIYTDSRVRSGIFTQQTLELLNAFGNQAAVAIENARLVESLRSSLADVTALNNLMDNVFESITSGVLTADLENRILLVNHAAASILSSPAADLVGRRLDDTLLSLAPGLRSSLARMLQTDQPVTGVELSPLLPGRGPAELRFSLSPLKDGQHATQGAAIVIDDLTEQKRLEAQSRLFERMVSPAVIEQLDPDSLPLEGQRAVITVLFADIRGFTSFAEDQSPERLVTVLNSYLAAAAEAVLEEEGTVDKFMGDSVMAWFNAPVPQADHAERAVRAAQSIRRAIARLHAALPESMHLNFGVGIHTGEAVLGLVGSPRRLDYTAIGDSVNTAKRIQENTLPGQVLLSAGTCDLLGQKFALRPVEPLQARGKRAPVPVFELVDADSQPD